MAEKRFGSTKRFGPRYGATNRYKFGKIEKSHRSSHKCPDCNYTSVKRVTPGIWQCRKCNVKFTGKAYTLAKKVVIKEEVTAAPIIEEVPEISAEESEEAEQEE